MAPDRAAALSVVRPQAGRTLLAALRHVPPAMLENVLPDLDPNQRSRVESLAARQELEFDLAAEVAELLGESAIAEFTVVGSAPECRRRVAELLEVDGVSELAVNVYGDDVRDSARDFMTQVLRPIADQAVAAT